MNKDKGVAAEAAGPLGKPEPGVSALRASVPNAEDIRKIADLFDPKAFEPVIERATQDIYERIMHSCEDYLRDNVDWNIGSHIRMLERENQQMRTELFEVDRALGCLSMGQTARLGAIKETRERGNQAANALWALQREVAAQGIEAGTGETEGLDAKRESPVGDSRCAPGEQS